MPLYNKKAFFCSRHVNIWNSLSNYVVEASLINTFKIRLHRLIQMFWTITLN